jgi:hypothetical protein
MPDASPAPAAGGLTREELKGPSITANWNAPPGQRWTIPLGGGVQKTFKLGDQLMQLGLSYFTNVKKPTYAPQTTLRANWSLLFPIKRGRPALPVAK